MQQTTSNCWCHVIINFGPFEKKFSFTPQDESFPHMRIKVLLSVLPQLLLLLILVLCTVSATLAPPAAVDGFTARAAAGAVCRAGRGTWAPPAVMTRPAPPPHLLHDVVHHCLVPRVVRQHLADEAKVQATPEHDTEPSCRKPHRAQRQRSPAGPRGRAAAGEHALECSTTLISRPQPPP